MWSGVGSKVCRTLLVELLDFKMHRAVSARSSELPPFGHSLIEHSSPNEKSHTSISTLQLFQFRSLLHSLCDETPQRRPPVVRHPPIF
jgi:hypothetical protein